MKRTLFIIIASVFVLFLFCVTASAKEPVPRQEFVKYTNAALDAADELEASLSAASLSRSDVNKAIAKMDAALKKYDRYVKAWPDCDQGQIVWRIAKARLLFQTHLAYRTDPLRGYGDKELEEATAALQEARDRFMKYNNRK